MTLKSGHEARHKLVSGRTGSVHSKKLCSPKAEKPTGIRETLIAGISFKTPEQIIKEPVVIRTKKFRFRNKGGHYQTIPEVPIGIVVPPPEPVTAVDPTQEAYGLILRATEYLGDEPAGSRGSFLLNSLLTLLEKFEKWREK